MHALFLKALLSQKKTAHAKSLRTHTHTLKQHHAFSYTEEEEEGNQLEVKKIQSYNDGGQNLLSFFLQEFCTCHTQVVIFGMQA